MNKLIIPPKVLIPPLLIPSWRLYEFSATLLRYDLVKPNFYINHPKDPLWVSRLPKVIEIKFASAVNNVKDFFMRARWNFMRIKYLSTNLVRRSPTNRIQIPGVGGTMQSRNKLSLRRWKLRRRLGREGPERGRAGTRAVGPSALFSPNRRFPVLSWRANNVMLNCSTLPIFSQCYSQINTAHGPKAGPEKLNFHSKQSKADCTRERKIYLRGKPVLPRLKHGFEGIPNTPKMPTRRAVMLRNS